MIQLLLILINNVANVMSLHDIVKWIEKINR